MRTYIAGIPRPGSSVAACTYPYSFFKRIKAIASMSVRIGAAHRAGARSPCR